MWSKHCHKKHHPGAAFSYPSLPLPPLFPFLLLSVESHVHQNRSAKSSRSCSLVLERTSCPEKGVLWRGLVALRTPPSQINFGIQAGGERPFAWGLIAPVPAQLSWLFHPAFALCLPKVSPSPGWNNFFDPHHIDSAAKPGSVCVHLEHTGHPVPANIQYLSETLWLPPHHPSCCCSYWSCSSSGIHAQIWFAF